VALKVSVREPLVSEYQTTMPVCWSTTSSIVDPSSSIAARHTLRPPSLSGLMPTEWSLSSTAVRTTVARPW